MNILFNKRPKVRLDASPEYNRILRNYGIVTFREFVARFEEKFIADRPQTKWAKEQRS